MHAQSGGTLSTFNDRMADLLLSYGVPSPAIGGAPEGHGIMPSDDMLVVFWNGNDFSKTSVESQEFATTIGRFTRLVQH